MADLLPTTPPTDAGAEPALAFASAPEPAPADAGYRVLARKYRPSSFEDLIGQDAMVRTLRNAFAQNRIPQAWMLTGVRGVGKTTTARILARGLNYEPADGAGGPPGPTVDLPGLGVHCRAIMESRHVDVLELDAASHTGVDNVRQITDSVRYAPSAARYRVYIIDEVHMLSTGAFNAFLKTLEEPPPHAKFVFATTEIRKVPVTILSRCQRFDLRRVEAGTLVAHLRRICALENVDADDEALRLVARAAEGSVRDALSLLDQAIAHGAGGGGAAPRVEAELVRDMLGLADAGRIVDLFEHVMRGDLAAALAELDEQHARGADPAVILGELAGFAHLVTRLKIAPDAADDASLTETERVRGLDMAKRLPMRVLARAWQMLLKAIAETQAAPKPLPAAQMALVRLAHAADLPTPDEALRALASGGSALAQLSAAIPPAASPAPALPSSGAPSPPPVAAASVDASARPVPTARGSAQPAVAVAPAPDPSSPPQPRSLREVADLADARGDVLLKSEIERDMRLVSFADGRIEFAPTESARPGLAGDLGRKLKDWTGRHWFVTVSREAGAEPLKAQALAARDAAREEARRHPSVAAVLARFPGAEIVNVRRAGEAPPEPAPAAAEALDAFEPDDALPPADGPPDDLDGFEPVDDD